MVILSLLWVAPGTAPRRRHPSNHYLGVREESLASSYPAKRLYISAAMWVSATQEIKNPEPPFPCPRFLNARLTF